MITDENAKKLIEENNLMLKAICIYLINKEQNRGNEDMKEFMSNVIADYLVSKAL